MTPYYCSHRQSGAITVIYATSPAAARKRYLVKTGKDAIFVDVSRCA